MENDGTTNCDKKEIKPLEIKKPKEDIRIIHSLIRDLQEKVREISIDVDALRRKVGLDEK